MKNLIRFTQKKTQSSLLIPHRFSILFSLCAALFLGAVHPIQAQLNFTSKKIIGMKNTNQYINDIFVNGSTLYLATDEGIFTSTDKGNSFTTLTKEKNGLGENKVNHIHINGKNIYAAGNEHLSTSKDGGKTFTAKTPGSDIGVLYVSDKNLFGYMGSLGFQILDNEGEHSFPLEVCQHESKDIVKMYADKKNVYVWTKEGLCISKDSGNTFQKSSSPLKPVGKIAINGATICASTDKGIAISTDEGKTFTYKTAADGLLTGNVSALFVKGINIYVATGKGLSVSTDGGKTFTNYTKENSKLVAGSITNLFVSGTTVYIGIHGHGLIVGTPTQAVNALNNVHVVLPPPLLSPTQTIPTNYNSNTAAKSFK